MSVLELKSLFSPVVIESTKTRVRTRSRLRLRCFAPYPWSKVKGGTCDNWGSTSPCVYYQCSLDAKGSRYLLSRISCGELTSAVRTALPSDVFVVAHTASIPDRPRPKTLSDVAKRFNLRVAEIATLRTLGGSAAASKVRC